MADVVNIFKNFRPIPEGKTDQFIAMQNGRLVITPEGFECLGRTARRLGIDLHKIRCYDQYLDMRAKMSPYFFEWMLERLDNRPDTLEYRGLRAILEDDDETYREVCAKLERIKAMNLRVVDSGDQ